jgi:hypothetical protein
MTQESATDLERRLAQAQRELSKAREQQTAAAKVRRIKTILANATRICEAKFGNLLLYGGAAFRRVALYNAPREWGDLTQRNPTIHPGPKDPLIRLVATKQLQHITDIRAEQRAARIAGAADGNVRGPSGYLKLAWRARAGVQGDAGERHPHLRSQVRLDVSA